MIHGKRDAFGFYQDNRHKKFELDLPRIDDRIEYPIHKEKSMTKKLPFVERVKALLRGLRDRKNVALTKTRTYEIEIFPTPIHTGRTGREKMPFVDAPSIKPRKQVGALHLSGKSSQLWSAHKQSDGDAVQTPSNLG